jgi:hypothetical protein
MSYEQLLLLGLKVELLPPLSYSLRNRFMIIIETQMIFVDSPRSRASQL